MKNEIVLKLQVSKKNKKRLRGDYAADHLSIRIHRDATLARNRVYQEFRGQYIKQELDSFAYLLLEKVIESAKIKKGDEINEVFGI